MGVYLLNMLLITYKGVKIMITTPLRENVLTEDVLHTVEEGKIFKGGYVAIIEYYTYANHWSDRKNIKRFRTIENANKFIEKYYK